MKNIVDYIKRFIRALKEHYYICYTIVFLFMCLVVFSYFWLNGKSFIWNVDGLTQHFTAYVYYAKYLRSIIKSILFEHTFAISEFSFSIGYGSDIMTTLSYYAIGDPITALCVFVPTRFMAYFYNFTVILRLYLASLTFSTFCIYISNRKEKLFSHTAVMIGTIVYIFSGYGLTASTNELLFINPMIYFPLVLLGIEMILDRKKPYMLIGGVFLSAISNFYFFYMIVVLTVIYVIWRILSVYTVHGLRPALPVIGKITIYSLLGTLMSAVILFPTILLFMGDARSSSGYTYDMLYSLNDYQKTISGFVAANTETDSLVLGYATIALLAVFMLFIKRRENRNIKILFIIGCIMLLLPFIGRAMNGFSYVCNRWIWGFNLLIGYIVVLMWDSLFTMTGRERLYLSLCLCAYFVLCMSMEKSRTIDYFYAMAMAFMLLSMFSIKLRKDVIKVACAGCVMFNICGNALLMYSPRFDNYVSQFVNMDDAFDSFSRNEATALKKLASDDEFSRYTGSITTNKTTYTGLSSTQYYWSLSNGNITEYQQELALKYGMPENYSNLNSRAALNTLANVRYYVDEAGSDTAAVPYGFESIGTASNYRDIYEYIDEKLGEDYDISSLAEEEIQSLTDQYVTTYRVYENSSFLPFGYTYDGYITSDIYDSLSPAKKQEAMLQAVAIDDRQEENPIHPAYTSRSVDYTIKESSNVEWEDNTIKVNKSNGSVTIEFDGMKNCENYLYIEGLEFEGTSPRDVYTETEWALRSDFGKSETEYQEKFWVEPTSVSINVSSRNKEDKSVSNSITYYTDHYKWYSNQHDYMINLYYDESPRTSITITFPTAGTYTFDDLEVICQPMNNYEKQVDVLREDTLENVDFHNDNAAFATSEVSGTITLDETKYLLLTIPYSSGWTAYVDGEKQELLQANTMYMALKLDAGTHDIVLRYHTPGKATGTAVSIGSVLIVSCIYLSDSDSYVRRKLGSRKQKAKEAQ